LGHTNFLWRSIHVLGRRLVAAINQPSRLLGSVVGCSKLDIGVEEVIIDAEANISSGLTFGYEVALFNVRCCYCLEDLATSSVVHEDLILLQSGEMVPCGSDRESHCRRKNVSKVEIEYDCKVSK
jgi:hypothetical protein